MRIKKNISIDSDLKDKAVKKAKSMGFDFSGYVTYLINRDLAGETAITTEPKKTALDAKQKSAISGILGD